MKIYFRDQRLRFKFFLDCLEEKKIMPYDKKQLRERVSAIELIVSRGIENLNTNFLFDYNIFPKNIMSFKSQWQDENREMRKGDNIVQQIYIPPTKKLSQKIITGVRISGLINQPLKKGFSYETLEGHVEKGISTFTIEQISENKLIFKIHTYSKPATLLTKLLDPIFSSPYQAFCTKAALKNVKRQIEAQ